MARRSVGSRLSSLISTPYEEESAVDVFNEALSRLQENKQQRAQTYSREIATVSAFEAKLDRQIANALRSGKVHSDSDIEDLRESIKSTYNADSDRFSSLRSEFTDSYESRLGELSEFSRRNKEWNNLENQVPIASENLLKLTEELTETEWDDLSQENKLKFKDRLMDQTQRVADLRRILKDPYNQSRRNYSQLGANISGISNGKLALLTQLSTFDPGKAVITEGEMQAMTQAIQNDDPALISAYNNEGLKRKVERANMMEASIKKNIQTYNTLVAFPDTPGYADTVKMKKEEEKEYIKKNIALPSDFWIVPMADGTEVNLLDQANEKRTLIDNANDIDESYRRENLMGASYKESFDVEFPWDVEPVVDAGDTDDDDDDEVEILSNKELMQKYKLNPNELDSLKKEHDYAREKGSSQSLASFIAGSIQAEPAPPSLVADEGFDKLLSDIDEEIKGRDGKDFRYGVSKETKAKLSKRFGSRFLTKLNNLYSTGKTYGKDSERYKSSLQKFRKYYQSKIEDASKVGSPIEHGLSQKQMDEIASLMTG